LDVPKLSCLMVKRDKREEHRSEDFGKIEEITSFQGTFYSLTLTFGFRKLLREGRERRDFGFWKDLKSQGLF